MAVSDQYIDFIVERFETIGPVVARKMFGGAGLYMKGLFYAIIANDSLYFKVDANNRQDFLDAGMKPFQPFPDKNTVMNYYEVPADVLEDDSLLKQWTKKALRAASEAN